MMVATGGDRDVLSAADRFKIENWRRVANWAQRPDGVMGIVDDLCSRLRDALDEVDQLRDALRILEAKYG